MDRPLGVVVAMLACTLLAGCAAQDAVAPAARQEAAAQAGQEQAPQSGQEGAADLARADARQAAQRGAPLRPPAPPPPDASRLVAAEIVDQSGFGRPMAALRLQVPAGWQTTGGIKWNDAANCYANMVQPGWAAIAPDSLSVIEVMPGFGWQVSGTQMQTDPCPVAPHGTAREFLEAVALASRPGARILDHADRPAWARRTEQRMDAQMRQLGQRLVPGQTRTVEAGSLLVAFQHDGIEMREVLSAVVSFVTLNGHRSGQAATVVSYRAPSGRLDMALAERVATTLEEDPRWLDLALPRVKRNIDAYFAGQRRRIDEWHSRQMAIIDARGRAERHAIRMRNNQEVANIYSAIAANTSATSDVIHRRGLEAIGEYNTYAGTGGTTVRSSIHDGNRVMQSTHDPRNAYSTDDPYSQPPSGYVELERVP